MKRFLRLLVFLLLLGVTPNVHGQATAKFVKVLRNSAGAIIGGLDVELRIGATLAYQLTESSTRPGEYYHNAVTHGMYNIYVNGTLRESDQWVGAMMVTDAINHFSVDGNTLTIPTINVSGTLTTSAFKVTGGTPGIGKVLTDSDGSGLASWQTPAGGEGGDSGWQDILNEVTLLDNADSVGIGITNAADKLHIYGTGATGGSVTIETNNASAFALAALRLFHRDVSPSDGEFLGGVSFVGLNDAVTPLEIPYVSLVGIANDITDGTENGELAIKIYLDGAQTDYLVFDQFGLTVLQPFSIPAGADAGRVWTATDATGLGSWQVPSGGGQWTDTGSILHPNEETVDEIAIGGTSEATADIFLGNDGNAVFNKQQTATGDFQISGDITANFFFADVSSETFGIGSSATSTSKVSILGGLTAANVAGVKVSTALTETGADTRISHVLIDGGILTINTDATPDIAAGIYIARTIISEITTGAVDTTANLYVAAPATQGNVNYSIFSHGLVHVQGNITTSGTVDGVDISARDHDAITLASDADILLGLTGQQLTFDSQAANTFLAAPDGSASDPTFRLIVDGDIPAAIHRDNETFDDDLVAFDDENNDWTATNVGEALEELVTSINGGVPNSTTAKVHWSQLEGVPAGFADGADAGEGGGSENTSATNLGGELGVFVTEVGDQLQFVSLAATDFSVTGNVVTVDDDGHAHTSSTISGLDVSSDLNLTAGAHITLTDDDLSVDDDFVLNTGDVISGNLNFSDGTTDSPQAIFTPQAGTAWSVGVTDSDGDFNFLSASTVSTENVDISNPGAGVANLTVEGAVAASNISGNNTGDQTFTLTDDVTGTGTGTISATIPSGAVLLSELGNPVAGTKTFTMGTSNVIFDFNNSAGGMEWNLTGTTSGHLLEFHQVGTSASAGTHVVHIEAEDPDVVGLLVRHEAPSVAGGSDVIGVRIDTEDDNDVDWVPFLIQDDADGTPDVLFKINYQGAIVSPLILTSTLQLANYTTNGFVKTGSGNGTLSIDNSNYLTGNQNITLSGNVTGSGATAITTVIAEDVITPAMMANSDHGVFTYNLNVATLDAAVVTNSNLANMAQNTLKMRVAAGAGAPEDIDISAGLTLVTAAAGDYLIIEDASDGNLKRVDATDFIQSTHAAVTLGTDADVLLGLTGQQIDLDAQTANLIFAGPASGGAVDPTFRSLVDNDIPNNLTLGTVSGAVTLAGATSFVPPSGVAPTLDAAGEFGFDNNFFDSNIGTMAFYNGIEISYAVATAIAPTTTGQIVYYDANNKRYSINALPTLMGLAFPGSDEGYLITFQNAFGGYAGLAPGAEGKVLTSHGVGFDVTWEDPAGGTDAAAIHDNVAGEISAITAKATPTVSDFLVIEDAAAANAKKSITIGALETALEGILDHADLQGSLAATAVSFSDPDNNFTATNVDAALAEFDDVINGGVPNSANTKVDWSQLNNVPAGFADGTDDGAGGGAPSDADYLVGTANGTLTNEIVVGTTPGGELGGSWASPTIDADAVAINEVGDASADATIVMGASELLLTSTLDAANKAILTLSNTTADGANNTSFIELNHNDGGDANVYYFLATGDVDGSPVVDYSMSQTTFTIGSGIITTFTGTANFTSTFQLNSTTILPTGSELNFVDGVTSGIQGQLDNKQGLDADLTDLADGSLTGSKVGFNDTDDNWTATDVDNALSELDEPINGGVPNSVTAKVHWSQLLGVPAGFADNTDDGGAGNTLWDAIGDASTDGVIALAGHETDWTTTLDAAGEVVWTITNTTANPANSSPHLVLAHNAGADAQAAYLILRGDADGTPTNDYSFTQAGATFLYDLTIPGESFSASWDGVNEAATKNDIYDQLQQVSGTPDFVLAKLSSDQTTDLGQNNHVKWNTVSSSSGSGITMDIASAYSTTNDAASVGRFTVSTTAVYEVRIVLLANFSATPNDFFTYSLYNGTSGTTVTGAILGAIIGQTSTSAFSINPEAFFRGTLTAGVKYEARLLAATTDATAIDAANSFILISRYLAGSGAGGATTLNDIGDAAADGTIVVGAHEIDFTGSINTANEAMFTFTNTTADATADNFILDLAHNDGADANVFYFRARGDVDGSPVVDYSMSQTAFTVGSGIASTFSGSVNLASTFQIGGTTIAPTGTELNFVDGVTSAIQTQIDGINSSTLTFTNKSYDTQGTGNVFADIQEIDLGPMSWVRSSATLDSTWVGTNIKKFAYTFDASTDEVVRTSFTLPSYYTSGTFVLSVYWYSAAATSGSAVFGLAEANAGASANFDPALSAITYQQTTTDGTAGDYNVTTITLSSPGWAANQVVSLELRRDADGTGGTDSLVGDAIWVGATGRITVSK